MRIINDEKARLAEQVDNLRTDRERLAKERAEVEQQQQSLAVEKEKLETIALQVRQRSKDIEEMCLVSEDFSPLDPQIFKIYVVFRHDRPKNSNDISNIYLNSKLRRDICIYQNDIIVAALDKA